MGGQEAEVTANGGSPGQPGLSVWAFGGDQQRPANGSMILTVLFS